MEQSRLQAELGSECGPMVGLVVEGGALSRLLTPELDGELVDMCVACKSVVCCRVTPKQKAEVRRLPFYRLDGKGSGRQESLPEREPSLGYKPKSTGCVWGGRPFS